MSVNRVQLLSLLSVKRVCFGKLQTSLCINFYIEAHPPGQDYDYSTIKTLYRGGARGGLGGYSPPSEASSPPRRRKFWVLVGGNLAK